MFNNIQDQSSCCEITSCNHNVGICIQTTPMAPEDSSLLSGIVDMTDVINDYNAQQSGVGLIGISTSTQNVSRTSEPNSEFTTGMLVQQDTSKFGYHEAKIDDAYRGFQKDHQSSKEGGEDSFGFGQFLADIQQKQGELKNTNLKASEVNYFMQLHNK